MLNVALTGNAAAGKSSVAEHFQRWGATLIDSDALVAQAQRPGTETLAAIVDRFGTSVILSDGSLNRTALRGKVLGDSESLASLNAIVHPAIRQRRTELEHEAKCRGDRILVNEIPLLFEVLDPNDFDLVVLVDAPKGLRRERLLYRGLSEDEADRLIASQIPPEQKRHRCDIVIENGGTLDQLCRASQHAWEEICKRAVNL